MDISLEVIGKEHGPCKLTPLLYRWYNSVVRMETDRTSCLGFERFRSPASPTEGRNGSSISHCRLYNFSCRIILEMFTTTFHLLFRIEHFPLFLSHFFYSRFSWNSFTFRTFRIGTMDVLFVLAFKREIEWLKRRNNPKSQWSLVVKIKGRQFSI